MLLTATSNPTLSRTSHVDTSQGPGSLEVPSRARGVDFVIVAQWKLTRWQQEGGQETRRVQHPSRSKHWRLPRSPVGYLSTFPVHISQQLLQAIGELLGYHVRSPRRPKQY